MKKKKIVHALSVQYCRLTIKIIVHKLAHLLQRHELYINNYFLGLGEGDISDLILNRHSVKIKKTLFLFPNIVFFAFPKFSIFFESHFSISCCIASFLFLLKMMSTVSKCAYVL